MTATSDSCSGGDQLLVTKNDSVYTSCYCEENIWKLCEFISNSHKRHLEKCFVVFISNDQKMVPIWKQRAGHQEKDYLCVWDYHVIMVYCQPSGAQVYDFDTVLSFPEDFKEYSALTFRSDDNIRVQYQRMFRVIEAEVYLRTFSSNRSHMKGADGSWLKPPPDYPCISSGDCENNLDTFISMDSSVSLGTVLNLQQLNQRFS